MGSVASRCRQALREMSSRAHSCCPFLQHPVQLKPILYDGANGLDCRPTTRHALNSQFGTENGSFPEL